MAHTSLNTDVRSDSDSGVVKDIINTLKKRKNATYTKEHTFYFNF